MVSPQDVEHAELPTNSLFQNDSGSGALTIPEFDCIEVKRALNVFPLNPALRSWKILHSFCFALGGFTFIAGTACYFDIFQAYGLGACLYILGSCGFLGVDVLELATYYKQDRYLTINICLSLIGSILYILGSIGFLPSLSLPDGSTSPLGIWGFILGSFFIGSSQIWKVLRIGGTSYQSDDDSMSKTVRDDVSENISYKIIRKKRNPFTAFRWDNIISHINNTTSFGVEFGACLGGWCFFFGTILYNIQSFEAAHLTSILVVWIFGSIFFTLGSLFLAYRHFRLDL